MKQILLLTLSFVAYTASNGQSTNIIKDIDSATLQLSKKPTLVYIVMPWCSVAKEDIVSIAPAISKYRDKFNLILVVDTNYYKQKYYKYFNGINDLKADKILPVNNYYPTGFIKKKEGKQLAKLFNSRYPDGPNYYAMGVSVFWLTDCNKKLISAFTLYQKGVEPFEKELKELPPCN